MTVSTYLNPDFLRRYEERVRIHWFAPFPQIINLLGDVRGKKILDIGCGSGDLAARLAQMGAYVIGMDISPAWIKLCRKRYAGIPNLLFLLADAAAFAVARRRFELENLDGIILNLVLPNVPTLKKVEKIFREVGILLAGSGVFIFSDLHPVCKMTACAPPRYTKYSKGFSFFKDGSKYTAGIHLTGDEVIEFQNVHWTLETYTRLLAANEMQISGVVESFYGNDAPEEYRGFPFPEYILYVCKKI